MLFFVCWLSKLYIQWKKLNLKEEKEIQLSKQTLFHFLIVNYVSVFISLDSLDIFLGTFNIKLVFILNWNCFICQYDIFFPACINRLKDSLVIVYQIVAMVLAVNGVFFLVRFLWFNIRNFRGITNLNHPSCTDF